MGETKIVVHFKANENNIKKLFVQAFEETKNVGWLMELLLCYPKNIEILKDLGLSINRIKSFTTVKKSETTSVNIELKRIKKEIKRYDGKNH